LPALVGTLAGLVDGKDREGEWSGGHGDVRGVP
jgi:hypothetical protein